MSLHEKYAFSFYIMIWQYVNKYNGGHRYVQKNREKNIKIVSSSIVNSKYNDNCTMYIVCVLHEM